jgi:hypothetical protein
MAIAADEQVVRLYVTVYVPQAVNHFERQQKRRGVKFCSVVSEDILALRGKDREIMIPKQM